MTLEEKAWQLTSVLPNQIRGPEGVTDEQMAPLLSKGIGQISAAVIGARSPAEIARLNNCVQAYLRDHTRLGIPALLHNEALNGINAPGFTSFPTAIGLAATWDPSKVREMTTLIRKQLKAVGIRQALAPVLDVARDARWGRVHETFGEEVALISALGVAYVKGMQGDQAQPEVIATAKHFLGYATTEGGQNTSATHAGPRELYDVFATPFEAAIREAGLASVMNSYSEVDGEPVVYSRALLTDLLRVRLGFQGTVVSDYRSIQYGVDRHGAAPDAKTSAVLALKAGLDVELPAPFGYGDVLVDAVRSGLVTEEEVDVTVLRVLTQKFALGLFENPFVEETEDVLSAIGSEGVELAHELADESITLLKNAGNVLPLGPEVRRVAVIGPHAETIIGSFANYTYPPMIEMMKGIATGRSRMGGMESARDELPKTLRDAFDAQVAEMEALDPEELVRSMYEAVSLTEALALEAPQLEVVSCAGSGVLQPLDGGIAEARALAASADLVVLAVGGKSGAFAGNTTEGEGTDSASMLLPAPQLELIDAVVAAGTPTVAAITMGRPYMLADIAEKVDAALAVFYPGPAGAPALARILTGRIAPSGKLPFTIPRSVGQVPIYQAQKRGSGYRRLPKDIFQGYIDLSATPLYAFGHGLSYVDFVYSDLVIGSDTVATDGVADISVRVRNTGAMPASEVVQFYLGLPASGVTRPEQQLVGFARVDLEPGETRRVVFEVPMTACGYTAGDGCFVVDPGDVEVRVGSASDDIRVAGRFAIIGERKEISESRSYFARASIGEASV
jgi:beta-glucosidase